MSVHSGGLGKVVRRRLRHRPLRQTEAAGVEGLEQRLLRRLQLRTLRQSPRTVPLPPRHSLLLLSRQLPQRTLSQSLHCRLHTPQSAPAPAQVQAPHSPAVLPSGSASLSSPLFSPLQKILTGIEPTPGPELETDVLGELGGRGNLHRLQSPLKAAEKGSNGCVDIGRGCARHGSAECRRRDAYGGDWGRTVAGIDCIAWSEYEDGYPRLGSHNFCRNPDADISPWSVSHLLSLHSFS